MRGHARYAGKKCVTVSSLGPRAGVASAEHGSRRFG